MALEIHQIAEAFCSHKFDLVIPHMADDIQWIHIGGQPDLVGRQAVIAQCQQAAKFLATVSSTITKLKSYRADPYVIVEGGAQFRDHQNQTSSVASCDIFKFSGDRLVEITSYVIELDKS